MAVKSIKLRGITNNPSDRMMEEGGVAESINVFLDNTENRPAAYPREINDNGKLPKDKMYDVLYMHQGNYICRYLNGEHMSVGTWEGGSFNSFCILDNEVVTGITSIGNTIVINTNERMHYVLYKNGSYHELGPHIPIPDIKFYDKDVTMWGEVQYMQMQRQQGFDPFTNGKKNNNKPAMFVNPFGNSVFEYYQGKVLTTSVADMLLTEKEGAYTLNDTGFLKSYATEQWVGSNFRPLDRAGEAMLANLWKGVNELRDFNHYYGILNSPVFLTFAVRLYDGSVYSPAAPIALGMGSNSIIKHPNNFLTKITTHLSADEKTMIAVSLNEFDYGYKIHTIIGDLVNQYEGWGDIVEGVDIYITNPVRLENDYNKCKVVSVEPDSDNASKHYIEMVLDPETVENHAEDALVSDMVFHKIISYNYEDFDKYSNNTFPINEDLRSDSLAVKETMPADYSSNHEVRAQDSMVYNGRLSVYNAKRVMSKGYEGLNGAFADAVGSIDMGLRFIYEIMSEQGETLVVYSDEISNQYAEDLKVYPFGFLSYPDARCRSVIVGVSNHGRWTYKRIPMKEMQNADCSYCYAGLNVMIQNHPQAKFVDVSDLPAEYREEDCRGYVFQSAFNNPYLFPYEGKHQICNAYIHKVVPVTTPLSEGQHGDHSMYVFSEEGIWALRINMEGEVQKPEFVTMDIAVSKNSISQIDQAVVFVTKKGVKMLTGSNVSELSSFMTGHKWKLTGSNEELILKQNGLDEMVPVMTTSREFMAFMEDAFCIYDYTGGRLIFINPAHDNCKYQYVYMLTSQSWHKIMFEGAENIEISNPVNSYPECLVSISKLFVKGLAVEEAPSDVDEQAVYELLTSYGLHDVDIESFVRGETNLDLHELDEDTISHLQKDLDHLDVRTEKIYGWHGGVMDFGTVLTEPDDEDIKGIIVTRGLSLDNDDVLKTIKAVKIRGSYERYDSNGKPRVQYILQGSQDGVNYFRLGSLKGKAWKMFRIIVMFTLKNTETISWIDVQYDTVFTNKLR